jgi:hypothetical protein
MAYMSDEVYEYFQDTKEKRFTARSARNKRGHTGKVGAMRTAADYMTQKQLRALNGECVTYRLGAPMSWNEFSMMPDDLKVMYIKKLRKNYNVPDDILATHMDVEPSIFNATMRAIGLGSKTNADWAGTDDCGRFLTWWVVEEE